MSTKSRFFNASSSESSDSESDASSEDEEIEEKKEDDTSAATRGASKWAIDSDSDSDDEMRTVKSEKDKRLDAMRDHCNMLKNKIKINDWAGVQAEFLKLQKALDNAALVLKEVGIPSFYIGTLVVLQDAVMEVVKDKARYKKLSKNNSKAVTRMKFHYNKTKHILDYAEEMEKYRANPNAGADSSSSSSSSSSDSDSGSGSDSGSDSDSDGDKKKKDKSGSKSGSDSGSDSNSESEEEQWDNDSLSSDSEDDEASSGLTGRARWVKKVVTKEEMQAAKQKEEAKKRLKEEQRLTAANARKAAALDTKKDVKKKEETLTPKILQMKLNHLIANRGKKGGDSYKQIETLRVLSTRANTFGARKLIPVLMYYISAMFDTVKMIDAYMSIDVWLECHRALARVLEKLSDSPHLKLGPIRIDDLATQAMANQGMNKGNETARLTAEAAAREEDGESKGSVEEEDVDGVDITKDDNDANMLRVPGDLCTYIQRLSADFTKSLQQTDPNTSEYVERLNNEGKFLTLATEVQEYYMRHHLNEGDGSGTTSSDYSRNAGLVAIKRIAHMYYKHDDVATKLEKHAASVARFGATDLIHPACKNASSTIDANSFNNHPGAWIGSAVVDSDSFRPSDFKATMADLCRFVFSPVSGADKNDLARAQLCQVYYHALHDRFHQARDLMLMSKLEPTSCDIEVQIVYNRTVAQLGLCAFRVGLYQQSMHCLSEICGRSKQKELLAQGMSYFRGRGQERDVDAERAEKRRQVPYHHHINLEMVECFQLIASMIYEVPWMAAPPSKYGRWTISQNFRRLMDNSERQVFNGPPETPKEHIFSAVRSLRDGDWRGCSNDVFALDRIWALVPNAKEVQESLLEEIKRSALKTFLFSYSTHYDSMSLDELVREFEMSETSVHSMVSKMMIDDELPASWDQPTNTIVLYKREPSKLQEIALQFVADTGTVGPLTRFVSSNELALSERMGANDNNNSNNGRRGNWGNNRRNNGGQRRRW